MRILIALLLATSNAPVSDSVKCYTCEKICEPDKNAWNVTQCAGSCRTEFMKLPGNSNSYTGWVKKSKQLMLGANVNQTEKIGET